MNRWWRGKTGAVLVFLMIASLVVGGLAHATLSALRLEEEQHDTALRAELAEKVRLALWRLDSRLTPSLAREDSRPSSHYGVLHAPLLALKNTGSLWPGGQVWLPSPLLDAELPEWMLLHFQLDPKTGWHSPQVVPDELAAVLRRVHSELRLANVTENREHLLKKLGERFPPQQAVGVCEVWGIERPSTRNTTDPAIFPTPEPPEPREPYPVPLNNIGQGPGRGYEQQQSSRVPQVQNMIGQTGEQDYALRQQLNMRGMNEGKGFYQNDLRNYPAIIFPNTKDTRELLGIQAAVEVRLGSMKPVWFTAMDPLATYLLYVRAVQVGEREIYQGVVLDWERVRGELLNSIVDLFPDAQLRPLTDGQPSAPERTMTALPVELDHGPLPEPMPTGWSAVRVGLAFAWVAAFVAITAVGLGGASLLELSERRIRFVSAVTHELRTPLTTLRLYLDLLTSGMVTDERQREEYLTTLHAESDRLHRLIGNVLDFARLEKQRPTVQLQPTPVDGLLEQLRTTWADRCAADGKALVIENHLPPATNITTDASLVQQIIGNLIDNAKKYTRLATDPRIWVRAGRTTNGIYIEVEDRGPGVPIGEKTTIFRPFCRGRDADVTAGGVGLGLALARRWATLLRGSLHLEKGEAGIGARFRLELG